METKHIYSIALLDGDLVIINPSLPEYASSTSSIGTWQSTSGPATTIAERIHTRETELPHILLEWAE